MSNDNLVATPSIGYTAPELIVLGTLHELTLNGCYWGKEFGGSDGFTFMGINVPISNCSP